MCIGVTWRTGRNLRWGLVEVSGQSLPAAELRGLSSSLAPSVKAPSEAMDVVEARERVEAERCISWPGGFWGSFMPKASGSSSNCVHSSIGPGELRRISFCTLAAGQLSSTAGVC